MASHTTETPESDKCVNRECWEYTTSKTAAAAAAAETRKATTTRTQRTQVSAVAK